MNQLNAIELSLRLSRNARVLSPGKGFAKRVGIDDEKRRGTEVRVRKAEALIGELSFLKLGHQGV